MPPSSLVGPLRAALKDVDPTMAVVEVKPLVDLVDRAVSPRKFLLSLLGGFAGVGLLLASLGIYGVISYGVAQRVQEIGVRMALGATRGDVVTMVLRRAGGLMLLGLLIGGAGAWYLSAGVKAFLFEVQPNDVGIFAAALSVLALAGLLASALPARRAAAVDPLVALRAE